MPVPDGLDAMRVDAGLARLLGLSRTVVATLAEEGSVLVDGVAVGKSRSSDRRVVARGSPARTAAAPDHRGDTGRGNGDPLRRRRRPWQSTSPSELPRHASVGWTGPTVIGGLAAAGFRISTSGAHERQGIVHRLDVGTSGVMVVATSERAYTLLKRAFKQRTIDKRYHALVQGHPDPSSGTIDAPIGRHHGNDWRFTVTADGKPSVTHYDTIEAFQAASLLDVHLETGRTHQIRVHFSALRHPCCGDLTYGADPRLAERLGLERQWLHAVSLGFAHPADGRWVEIKSKYPKDLEHALEVLRSS